MQTEGERIARLETLLGEVRDDVREMKGEEARTRRRLHDVEGALGMLVDQEKVRKQATVEQQRRLHLRISALTVVVALASLGEPFLYHIANGR